MIIAIDPGYGRMGVCVGNNVLITYTCLETYSKDTFEQRLFSIYNSLEKLIQENNVEIIVYEMPYLRGEMGAKINQVIGVISVLAAKYDLKIVKYTPSKIKKVVCGNGKATKKDVEKAVCSIYNLPTKLLDDLYDACSVFHCYITEKLNEQI